MQNNEKLMAGKFELIEMAPSQISDPFCRKYFSKLERTVKRKKK